MKGCVVGHQKCISKKINGRQNNQFVSFIILIHLLFYHVKGCTSQFGTTVHGKQAVVTASQTSFTAGY